MWYFHWQILLCLRKPLVVLKKVILFWGGFQGGAAPYSVISKRIRRPHYFIARIAGILQAFNVFLNVLSHVGFFLCCVPTICAVITVNPFFNHWFYSSNCSRFNEWILLCFLLTCRHCCSFKRLKLIFKLNNWYSSLRQVLFSIHLRSSFSVIDCFCWMFWNIFFRVALKSL